MTNIQERLLESKMTEIEQARSWSPRVISRFETLIRSGDDLSLYRVVCGCEGQGPRGTTKEVAILRWNKRPRPSARDAVCPIFDRPVS